MHQDAGGEENPIRVLHVAENVKGGIATYLDSVLKYRAEKSNPTSVSLLLPASERPQVAVPEGVIVETYEYGARGPLSLLKLMWMIWRAVKQIQPDVVHFHSSFPGFAGRLPMMFTKSGVISVFCAHGWSFEMDMPNWRKVLFGWIEKLLSWRTDAVVNISLSDHNAALGAGLTESRCIYIPNGIDFPEASRDEKIIPQREGVVNLLFVGRFDRQKGIDLLMDAMGQLQEEPIRLFVVGETVLGGVEVVPSSNVEFLGWRSRDRLRSLFAAADAVVMPSRWEGFGMVAIEAMC
ncbi:MAG: glycosyltransferase, partial [Gammaproteobacteria bacterium]